RGEIQSLLDRLSSTFGVSVSPEDLAVSFRASNKTRALLRKAEDLVRRGRVGMTGLEWTEFSRAGGLLPRKIYDGFLRRLIDQSRAGPERNGVPILLTGSMLENPEIVAMIEECGGRVVAQDLCVSGRQSEEPISLTQDPLAALARHYLLRPPCARMQESRRRIDHVMSLVRSHGVRGVVYYVLKFCDTFLYEAPVLKRRLAQAGIPMLIIESDYQGGRGGGIYTRVQAFLEMLGVRAAQATCEAGV
ncbi:MAG: 2-hydroxyacyl-CoA dehydratase subunit D, partial [Candidatus Aminicenantales bacterium]